MEAQDVLSHNRMTLQNLEKGDLVEFDRGLYSHWAVYAGNGKVIHLAGDENAALKANVNSGHVFTISGARFSKADVKKDNFWDVTHGSKAYIRNDKMSPFKPEEIVRRAAEMIGRDIGYNVLWNNCEHFASYCRYGKWESEQSETGFAWVARVIGNFFYTLYDVAFPRGRSQPTKKSTGKKESD